uniref:Brorin isoform X3 n=1 Tax=uncultured bacterium pAP3 TaxID=1781154 RepID=A0A1C9U4N8_9BACT|nr:brorin isoform X3 [uncultured bacterium pAP3]
MVLGPADIGGAHRPHAPQQQDGEDETEHDGGDGPGRKASVGREGGNLVGGRRHGDGASLSGVALLRV